jgi:predicted Rossmann fold flavoprotein
MEPIIVIGAGGAGLLAAARAAESGARVVLLERNARPGMKLLISGGGKCNITHDGTMEHVRSAFLPREARFLKPSFHTCTNREIRERLERQGVTTMVRDDERVFPASGRAKDVVDALVRPLHALGVEIRLGTKVEDITADTEGVSGARTSAGTISGRRIILATGGASYQKTGTTGDGFRWAAALGHTIVPIRPALAPIRIAPPLPSEWRGIAVRNGRLTVIVRGKHHASWAGDILITHEGISGPAALGVSRDAALALESGPVDVSFDFFPDRDYATLDADLLELSRSRGARTLETVLDEWLPNRMVPWLLERTGIPSDIRGFALTREHRRAIVGILKQWRIGSVASISLDRGEVSAGGISLDEVDPRTMHSRKVRGLYLCGEVLDIAGPVGGYNLQAAFSTGYVAGESAAKARPVESSGPCERS